MTGCRHVRAVARARLDTSHVHGVRMLAPCVTVTVCEGSHGEKGTKRWTKRERY